MRPVTLRAHFDRERIVPNEPLALPVNTPIIITVEPVEDMERQDWTKIAAAGLVRAYGEDEPEYTLADIKPGTKYQL
jgi:hypothetical protein